MLAFPVSGWKEADVRDHKPSSRQVPLKPASPDSGHFSPDENPSSSVTTTCPKPRLAHRLPVPIKIRPDLSTFPAARRAGELLLQIGQSRLIRRTPID